MDLLPFRDGLFPVPFLENVHEESEVAVGLQEEQYKHFKINHNRSLPNGKNVFPAASIRKSSVIFCSRQTIYALLCATLILCLKNVQANGANGGSTAEAGTSSARTGIQPRGELCRQWISSDVNKNGNFTSPNYPDPYPADVHCSYQFLGKENERVQILFTDFELHLSQSTEVQTKDNCEAEDAVMVFITIRRIKERVDNFCGNKLPPQLMSNGPNMTVDFNSYTSHSTIPVRGFRAIYRFVTNYGITAGEQDLTAGCTFTFNSSVRGNGTFMSPNWPGYYPRDTECHYFFLGKTSERVFITFAYFDVDGIPLCSQETASDYVEFSNFRTVDRKLPRHCGVKKPDKIESDGDFFRITFKSNDKFDGTGFEAFYQFRSNQDPANQVKKHPTSTSSTSLTDPTSKFGYPLLILFLVHLFLRTHDSLKQELN